MMNKMNENTIQCASLAELASFAGTVLEDCVKNEQATVIALKGDLGVGKTAFVKALAKHLGVEEEVTSPTFGIMKSYQTTHGDFSVLTHIDAYRIEDIEEMRVLRFEEFLKDANRIICIEWPERIAPLLPKDSMTISFTINHDESRDVSCTHFNHAG